MNVATAKLLEKHNILWIYKNTWQRASTKQWVVCLQVSYRDFDLDQKEQLHSAEWVNIVCDLFYILWVYPERKQWSDLASKLPFSLVYVKECVAVLHVNQDR